MITKRQKQVLDFVKKFHDRKGFSPSLEEIGKKIGLTSVSTVHHHIRALEDLGYIKKINNQPRAIDVYEKSPMIQIPLLGTIAAGQPIEAVKERETIAIPQSNLSKIDNLFALRVKGSSMIDENIADGDIVIVRSQSSAENGQKVVALVNNSEVTLKKFYNEEKGVVRLQPANKSMEPMFFKNGDLELQGVVVDVIKNQKVHSINPEEQNLLSFEPQIKKSDFFPIDQIVYGESVENMKKMPDNSIDLVIADPPYNLSHGNSWSWNGEAKLSGFGGAWNKVMESWDNMSIKDYFAFSFAWLSEVKRILKPTGSIWVFGTYHNIGVINTVFQILGIEIINEISWYKRNAFPNLSGRRLTASHETLLWGHVGNKKREYYFNYEASKNFSDPSDGLKVQGKQMRTVWDIPNNKEKEELKFGKHPTQKPLRICRRIIELSSSPKAIILSPFAGAGSECVAAKEMNRHYIGIELEEEYVSIANKRLANVNFNDKLF